MRVTVKYNIQSQIKPALVLQRQGFLFVRDRFFSGKMNASKV